MVHFRFGNEPLLLGAEENAQWWEPVGIRSLSLICSIGERAKQLILLQRKGGRVV